MRRLLLYVGIPVLFVIGLSALAIHANADNDPIIAERFEIDRPAALPEAAEPAPVEPGAPATRAAEKVLSVLDRVSERMRTTRYQHRTVVNESRGHYGWDCSGMAAWVLKRSSPRALRALHRERPVAATFFDEIERAPIGRARAGWERLAHIEDARPGDVFAWLRPPDWPRRNTGHVGFVLEQPRRVPGWSDGYTVRVADATSVPHQDDSRGWPGEGGFGTGTLLFMTDGQGNATAYGWFGTLSRGVVPTRIVFGRLH
jgi:hypothetical protein